MKKNQVVNIYQKPITGEDYEGKARLIESIKEDVGDGLSIWLVEFTDEKGETYTRTVNEKNAFSEIYTLEPASNILSALINGEL